MNNKFLIILFIIPTLILCNAKKEDKKNKTIINNGISYKINNSSNHITPLDGINVKKEIKKTKKLNDTGYKFYTTFGHMSPLGENLRSNYDPSYSFGFVLDLPQSFSLFKKDWELSVSTKHTRFNNNNVNAGPSAQSFSMLDFMTHVKTELGPVLLNLGLGITDGRTTTNTGNTNRQTALSMKFDVGYQIIKEKDFDLILNMSLQETLLGPLSSNNSEKTSTELMGINLQFGKKIKF